MLGFVPFALVLGAQAVQKGLAPLEVPLMTGMNFGGGSEFTAIRLWTSPPHVLLIVAMSFLVNCRHILMGAALALSAPSAQAPCAPGPVLHVRRKLGAGLADAQRSAAGA